MYPPPAVALTDVCPVRRRYQEQFYERHSWFDLQECLDSLPPQLECELLGYLYITDLKLVKCFSTMPERVMIALSGHVMPYHVLKDDVLYQPGL